MDKKGYAGLISAMMVVILLQINSITNISTFIPLTSTYFQVKKIKRTSV